MPGIDAILRPPPKIVGVLGALLLVACTTAPVPEAESAGGQDETLAPAGPQDVPGFPGSKIYLPATTPAPGIVMLHGSEGGTAPYMKPFAAQLASAGFVVVTLCWYGCPGKPDKILDIPLGDVIDIGQWLKASPNVAGGKVGLFGWSRGGELSLLVSSLAGSEPFRAVAVHAPSDTVVAAYDPATANAPPYYGLIVQTDPATGQSIPAPAWTWRGSPLFGEPTLNLSIPGPTIAVTSYTGPVYVSQGENDQIWSVARGRHVVAERNAVPGLVTESHFYPGEGHVLQRPEDVATMYREVASFFTRQL
jgi:nucleolar protein 56